MDKAFGQWEGPVYSFIIYWIDNEIHHRGQAYVYLRSLGMSHLLFMTGAKIFITFHAYSLFYE